jgi:phage terminase small subunit
MTKQLALSRDLNDQQAAFVRSMALTGNAALSVAEAGYKTMTPASVGAGLLRTPHVLAALQNEVRRRLVASAPMALRVITEIVQNETVSPKVRLDGARILLERAGHVAPRPTPPADIGETPLHEMSTDELRSLAGRLEDEIAGRAKVVPGVMAPAAADSVDLVG